MDDILIYTPTLAAHASLLAEVLQILSDNKLFANPSKCSFAQSTIKYLGHVISQQGVATDPQKIQTVQHWPTPSCVKEVRFFGTHWVL